tara:strand:+ start:114 stop:317 length:204 start_codon:yes stop_codon:yes gene_type:complete
MLEVLFSGSRKNFVNQVLRVGETTPTNRRTTQRSIGICRVADLTAFGDTFYVGFAIAIAETDVHAIG